MIEYFYHSFNKTVVQRLSLCSFVVGSIESDRLAHYQNLGIIVFSIHCIFVNQLVSRNFHLVADCGYKKEP